MDSHSTMLAGGHDGKRSIAEILDNLVKRRRIMASKLQDLDDAEWEPIDQGSVSFEIPPRPPETGFVAFNFGGVSPVDLFFRFLDEPLLRRVWDDGNGYGRDDWSYNRGTAHIHGSQFHQRTIYAVLAMKIRIQGLARRSTTSSGSRPSLKVAVNEARSHLLENIPGCTSLPHLEICEHLISSFLLSHEYFGDLSKNFRSIVQHVGDYVSGGEMTFSFTGESYDIKFAHSKPNSFGDYFCELVAPIDKTTGYLLDISFWENPLETDECEEAVNTVQHWCKAIESIQPGTRPILTFDCYHFSQDTHQYLLGANVKYMASVSMKAMTSLRERLPDAVTASKWSGLWNERTHELYVHFRSKQLGKKQVFTNIVSRRNAKPEKGACPPGLDLYEATSKSCDQYNLDLHNNTWPFRRGGGKRLGRRGHEDDFAFSCMLLNIRLAYFTVHQMWGQNISSSEFCCNLADEIMRAAVLMP